MRRIRLYLLMGVAVVLQISLLPALRLFDVVPNVALVMMVLCSVWIATSESLSVAVVAGAVLDIASGVNFGLWMGVMMTVSLAAGLTHRAGIELDQPFTPIAFVLAGTTLTTLVIWIGMASSVMHWSFGVMAGRLGVELLLNLGLVIGLRPFVRMVLGGEGFEAKLGDR